MSSDVAISVRNVTKTYRIGTAASTSLGEAAMRRIRKPLGSSSATAEFRALDGVSLDVAQGEIVGIIGRNGAGKSTLLKLLSRITSPDDGEIDIVGRVGSLLEVGTGFHPELTGRENVYLNGAILGMRRREIARKFDEIVEFAEVEQFLETPVKRYSSGMYVRLAFAVAAHLESEIAIVDEVLAVGDAAFQARCLAKIESLSRVEGRTVLFVSHSMTPVRQMCERVVVLHRGKVDFVGSPADAIPRYLDTASMGDRGSAAGVWDLTERTNEHGDRLMLRSLRVESGGTPTETVVLGDPVELCFELDLPTALPRGVLGVCFASDSEQPIASFTTVGSPGLLDRSGHVTVRLTVDRMLLTPGQYYLYAGLSPVAGGHLLDQVARAAAVRVVDRNADDAEFYRVNGQGVVQLDASWTPG